MVIVLCHFTLIVVDMLSSSLESSGESESSENGSNTSKLDNDDDDDQEIVQVPLPTHDNRRRPSGAQQKQHTKHLHELADVQMNLIAGSNPNFVSINLNEK